MEDAFPAVSLVQAGNGRSFDWPKLPAETHTFLLACFLKGFLWAIENPPQRCIVMRHILSIVLILVIAVLGLGQPSFTPCNDTGPRIRKPWSLLTTRDKWVYVNAVADAMAAGFHQRFVEIHTEPSTSYEAHGCMFLYWHRKFLLAYENMLRSLKPDYACLTIPYWDYATLSSQYVARSCTSMYQCATDVINYFGGTVDSTGLSSWSPINGNAIGGNGCVQRFPLNNYCQSSSAVQTHTCMRCLPRNDYSTATVPPEINIVPVFAQIFGGPTLRSMSDGVQLGCHNNIHSKLASVMAQMESPADPLFLLHHVQQRGQIDLMHRIFFKCRVADAGVKGNIPVLTDAQKRNANDPRLWTSCTRLNGTTINPTDPVRMLGGEFGQPKIDVHDPASPLYTYFKDLPRPYYMYADGDDMGSFSHRYIYTGMLADMLTQCAAYIAPKGASLLSSNYGNDVNPSYVDRCVDRPRLTCERTQTSFIDYVSRLAGDLGWSHGHLTAQIEAMVCAHHNECLGGVRDFSASFKASFHPNGPPRCKVIMDRLESNRMFINLPNWRTVVARFFPCPNTTATVATS
ncbi:Aste57867_18772 [Aphanomyces stellatus]|uniref:Aste57867_18772 protein n=1 Tax=Aphanomyces stellatus TaxID=120398 RepID=A0A485LCG2_9STRA|nr:hypothetical protein As57867_018708 [Aphanomyces stellatus]VFT95506.1 Aste57867_18772 [Aphanomyces stellatus]